jgi:hypothetical protein|tara:strand:+ start:589 stop:822 length:234 start_codon:yes stop_codon:yes gene_type:complete
MAGPELQAFRELDKMGLILEGEFFSPFLAGQDHYTQLLAAIKADRLGIKRREAPGHQSKQCDPPPVAEEAPSDDSAG